MSKLVPFLWFDSDAEQAADFYLKLFRNARKTGEMRANGVGPWAVGAVATVSLEIEGQPVVLMNGGPGHPQTDAFSFVLNCDSQAELDEYWDRILAAGGQPLACGWIRDQFGVNWQVQPRNMIELVSHPKAMTAMMGMVKLDIAQLEKAAKDA